MPKPKVNKVLAYRKCQQCRKDRQKCSPEGRSWPGRRCDRCQRYGYACSANRTKDEEIALSNTGDFTRNDAGSGARNPSNSPEIPSLPQGDAESEARCLQELGDYHQILNTGEKSHFLPFYVFKRSTIRKRIDDCVKRITVKAQIHQIQGRYKDAEYLCRQLEAASAPLTLSDDGLLKLELDIVLIYERLGNLPAAEILQEHRLIFSMRPEQGLEDAIISREAENLFRLYILFVARVEDLDVMANGSILLMVFYRIAVLGCSQLNALLFQSELWTRYNAELCLHIAIRIPSTEMIRGLISIGVDINRSGDDWNPPLMTAARYGNIDSLKLLLENNVYVGAKRLNNTALHSAMLRDAKQSDETYEIIRRLIKAGVDVNARDSVSRTPLHSAVLRGPEPEEKVICCLIEAGVDIEAEDLNNETALKLAVRRGYMTTVRLLLQQGANTEVCGIMRETPLSCAVRYADESMVELLLDHSANIEAQNWGGYTPLHHAVKYKQIEMVGLLLKKGASVAAYNNSYQTPVDIARLDDDQILVDMLLDMRNENT